MIRWGPRALVLALIVAFPAAELLTGHEGGEAPPRPRSAEAVSPPPRELTLRWIEVRPEKGECSAYEVGLAEGQALRVVIEQRGADVRTTIEGSGGDPLVLDGLSGRLGPDGGTWVARRAGRARVTVCAAGGMDVGGSFRVRRQDLRAATAEDARLEAAYRAYRRGVDSEKEPVEALPYFEAARDGFRAVGAVREEAWAWQKVGESLSSSASPPGADRDDAAAAFGEAARLYVRLGEPRQVAMAYWHQATQLAETDRCRVALEAYGAHERWAREAGDLGLAARALRGKARCSNSLGRVIDAIAAYEEALELHRRIGDAEQECTTRFLLGRLYLSSYDLERALQVIGEARRVARAEGLRLEEAKALTRMAEVLLEADQHRAALALLNESKELGGEDEPRLNFFDRENALGRAYGGLGETEKARAAYTRALAAARTSTQRVNVQVNLASLYEASGNFEGAVEHCRAAAAAAIEDGDLRHGAAAHACIAYNRERQQRLGEALEAIRQAVNGVEDLRARYAQEDLRISYFADKQRYFDLYLELLYRRFLETGDRGFLEESFAAVERSKARALLDGLSAGTSWMERELEPDLLDRRERLHRERARLLADDLRGGGDGESARASAEVRRRLAALDVELDTLRGRIFSLRPGWQEVLGLRPLGLEKVRASLLRDSDTQIVSYFLGERTALVWVVGEETLVVRALSDPRRVEELAERAVDRLSKSSTPTMRSAAERALAELGREVIDPIASELTAGQLILVKGGALDAVPFAGFFLPGRKGEEPALLGTKHRLVEAPSASAAVLLRSSRAKRPAAPLTLAVFADPVYQHDDERISVRRKRGVPLAESPVPEGSRRGGVDLSELPRLEGSREEALAIARMVRDPDQKLVSLDFAANREAITRDLLQSYQMIHFATHGIAFDDVSALVLSRWDRAGRPIPRYLLEEWEIYDLKLDADLVVLSACRTGRGPRARGEGVLGLARAFLWAGASRVVATLWDVDDDATRYLMVEFYERMLVHHDPPAEALRRAQASVRSHPRWESPHYWAGFVLQGDGS